MNFSSTCSACGVEELLDWGGVPDGRLFRCPSCRSLHLDCKIVADETQYGSAYRRGHDSNKPEKLMTLLRQVKPSLDRNAKSLLDVGCGDGDFLVLARYDGWKVCGIDADTRSAEFARRRDLDAFVGCLGKTQQDCGRFDVVTLWDVIEHVANLEGAMNWLSRTVAPGGRLVILTPNADCSLDSFAHCERAVSFHRSQRLMHLCINRYHLHRFTDIGLSRLVSRFGFEVESISPVQLFSLIPEMYLSGFAPGMNGWTSRAFVNGFLSRAAYASIRALGIKNKLFMKCLRVDSVSARTEGARQST